MAIQTRILEAEYDSDAVDAGLNYVCVEIYEDDYTPEYDGDEGLRKTIKFDFQSEYVRLGLFRKDLVTLLSGILLTYEGATKDQLTLPTIRSIIEFQDSNGSVVRKVERYEY